MRAAQSAHKFTGRNIFRPGDTADSTSPKRGQKPELYKYYGSVGLGATTSQAIPKSQSSKRHKYGSALQGDLTLEERRRRDSHQQNPSMSIPNFPSSSCSTTGSSQDEAPVPPQPHKKRQRIKSEGPRPSWRMGDSQATETQSQVSIARLGPVESKEERGRKKEKKGFLDRIRSRSISLTESFIQAIQYPGYLLKDKQERRQSKQQLPSSNGANSSDILATSATGHLFTYTPSNSTTTTTGITASPVSSSSHQQHYPPNHHGHGSSNHGHNQSHRRLNEFSDEDAVQREEYRASPMTKAKEIVLAQWEDREEYEASPMTKAKEIVLSQWEDVDLPRRQGGVPHAEIMISQIRSNPYPPISIPFAKEGPRRR
ncbi:2834_t:CDS:2 [Acaulospora colombiana]|uniref:2834_t:CDS:1 n=1 Tax=Acaulospora colombiana TaxID=27376 RepID=A0ACA9NYP4_9GLOM|nr:2834_t:CDS:2 [Acaulospora colombiana]